MNFKLKKLPSFKFNFKLPYISSKYFSKLGKKEKIRLISYIFSAIVIGFVILPALTTEQSATTVKPMDTKHQKVSENTPILDLKTDILGGIGLSAKSLSGNDWSVLQYSDKIRFREKIATIGTDGRLLIRVNSRIILALGGNSSFSLDRKDSTHLLVKLLSGCIGIRTAQNNVQETVFVSPPEGNGESFNLQNKKILCLNETNQLTEGTDNVFIPENFFYADYVNLSAIQPCNSTIEMKKGDVKVVVPLNFAAPALMKKLIELSQNEDFSSIIYQGSDFGLAHNSPLVSEGTYYWRIKDEYNKTQGSNICSFSVIPAKPITINQPVNDSIYTDGSLTFSWSSEQGQNQNYNIQISKNQKFTDKILTKDTNANTFSIDDIIQTLGPGTFYWKVKTSDGKESAPKRFYVLSENDFRIITPQNGTNLSPSSQFILFTWPALPFVKIYTILVSSNPSFNDTSYVASTNLPYAISSILPNGDYFTRLTAVFNNNSKLTNNVSKFSISDTKKVAIIRPFTNRSNYLRFNKKKKAFLAKFEWEEIAGAKLYVIKLNSRLPVNIKGKTTSVLPVSSGDNTISIDAFCDEGTRLCATSGISSFKVIQDISPELLSPRYGEAIYADPKGNVRIVWKKIPKREVEFEIAEDNDFQKIIASGVSSNNMGFAKITQGEAYLHLRVKGAEWGGVTRFTISPALPGIPVIIAPNNRKIVKHKKVVFEWNPTRGAEGYQIEIAYDPRFKKVFKAQTVNDTRIQFILKRGRYFWRIFSFDSITGTKRYSRSSKPRILIVKGR